MRRARRAHAAAALLALSACAPLGTVPGFTNPVLNRDFPDPAVLRAPDGRFYAYATQSESGGRVFNIQVAVSSNLVDWVHLGDALPAKPAWASTKQHFWAPHVVHDAQAGRYVLYYSAEPDEASGKCLAVATGSAPQGPFTDRGKPLLCGEGIEHIDPMAFDDPRTGKRLLYWGSGRKPIRVQELAPDRLDFAPGSAPRELLFPDERPYRTLIEAPWVHYRDGWYYLFYSGDRCCTRDARYAVMVARATDPLGPFEEAAAPILERNDLWLAPGHSSVLDDGLAGEWMLYHGIDAADFEASARLARPMMLAPLEYSAGWPRIRIRHTESQ